METGVGKADDPEDIRKGLEPRVPDSPIKESYSGLRFTLPIEGVADSRVRLKETSLLISGFRVAVSGFGLRNGNSSNTAS